ncbi:thiamine phosphate synthase [Spirilliplanes yamanashiensis]|uniref:Thiamine-phosphate synthase n=1 Tax=Spirilliplanes yamanashiensis TaxID=42233 RepID=A0A8J3YAD6_9ACTN|nr:thiamine phosphate synthase [Spirilliplanes yamanashiensis]MDP9815894.1 thiamine-phosphate pyrophosphorylase [Spirilliplanes yamanashiensis]GIJ04150.1 thiamine-phosphate synthase [Spirilliplanes yamanashiensis]
MGCAVPRLHLVTDCRAGRDALAVVQAAVAAGWGVHRGLLVQVRVEDDTTDRAAYELTCDVLAVCRPAAVPVLVNDRLHVALAAGADGAHVGADDLPVAAARRVLGPGAVLGATCRTPQDATAAVAGGATYLGVGPFRATTTKRGLPAPIGAAGVAAVAAAEPATPVVAIGGVACDDVAGLRAAGAAGVAVVGAVANAADPGRAVVELLAALA